MKQEDLFKKIGFILNELNEQYQFLADNPQQLSELELELFHANANFLADHVQIIKKINNAQQEPLSLPPAEKEETIAVPLPMETEELQEESQVEAVAFADEVGNGEEGNREEDNGGVIEEEAAPEITKIEEEIFKLDQSPATFEFILNDHAEHEAVEGILQTNFDQYAPNDKFEYEEKEVDELFDRPLSEEEEEVLAKKRKLHAEQEKASVDLEEEEDDEIGPEPFLVTPKEEVIEPEDLTLEVAPITETKVNTIEPVEDPNYKPTLNELLAKGNAANLNATSGKSITDLKQAISLNDKLLYIKDLFNGYNLAYSEAIDIANRLPNFEAADNFFQKNYAAKNNWSEKQATVDKFYQLLNQRFLV